MPTTTEPCFTASPAYSTWKIRPWGELECRQLDLDAVWPRENLQCDGVIVVVISEHLDNPAASAAETSRSQKLWKYVVEEMICEN
jgi:hypothetical protein